MQQKRANIKESTSELIKNKPEKLEKLKSDLEALKETLEHEKKNKETLEAKCNEASEVLKTLETGVESPVDLQEQIEEAEAKKESICGKNQKLLKRLRV